MRYFFQDSFIHSVQKLLRKNAYRDCERALIECIFKISEEKLFIQSEANRLNASGENPIVKMRIAFKSGKSSSFRVHFFIIKRKKELYFGHLYPKTGSKAQSALSKEKVTEIIRLLLDEVKAKTLNEVYLNKNKTKICYCKNDLFVWEN